MKSIPELLVFQLDLQIGIIKIIGLIFRGLMMIINRKRWLIEKRIDEGPTRRRREDRIDIGTQRSRHIYNRSKTHTHEWMSLCMCVCVCVCFGVCKSVDRLAFVKCARASRFTSVVCRALLFLSRSRLTLSEEMLANQSEKSWRDKSNWTKKKAKAKEAERNDEGKEKKRPSRVVDDVSYRWVDERERGKRRKGNQLMYTQHPQKVWAYTDFLSLICIPLGKKGNSNPYTSRFALSLSPLLSRLVLCHWHINSRFWFDCHYS